MGSQDKGSPGRDRWSGRSEEPGEGRGGRRENRPRNNVVAVANSDLGGKRRGGGRKGDEVGFGEEREEVHVKDLARKGSKKARIGVVGCDVKFGEGRTRDYGGRYEQTPR